MKVVVVGPGRVGTVLGAALVRAGHRVTGVAGGSAGSRERFRGRLAGVRDAQDPAELTPGADLVVLATPDDVLVEVVLATAAADGFRPDQRVVHVSGAHGLGALNAARLAGARVAACHPAQTVPSPDVGPDVLVGAAWAVTAAPEDRPWAHELVVAVGGEPHDVPDGARVLYHAGLVVGSNAVGAATAVARQLLLGAQVDDPEAFLKPLIAASVGNVLERGRAALTGPVVRGDAGTVEAHLAALDADAPQLAVAYRHLSRVILDQVRSALDDEQVRALEEALADRGEQRPSQRRGGSRPRRGTAR